MAGYVLIVEKDAELQQRIGAALREAGYELAAETEAAWARRSIAVRRPDAVVLGTRLGDGDGFGLADELRRDPDTREMPIVFIATTHRGQSHRAEARRRFAPADYLATPIDPQVIAPRLAELAAAPPAASPEQEPTPPPLAETVAKTSLRDPVQQREKRDVERSARSLVEDPGQAELAGTLKRTPLGRVLQRLYATRATGSLLLLRDNTKKIVVLADGYPVSVRSNLLSECLGQILLEKKLITGQALAASVSRMQKEKRQQGQILVEMGALSPYNLQRALVEQVEAKLLEIFSWPDGKFMFKAGEEIPAGATRLERPPAALILEGIRRHYDEARQKAVLARYAGQRVALSADPLLRLQEMTSDPTELAFIAGGGLDGTRQLEAIIAGATIPTAKARLLLVALSEAGMIQPVEGTSRRRRPTNPPAGPPPAPPPPAARSTSDSQPPPLGSGELSMMLQMARTQDHFWALGVSREASLAEIDRAYEALARSFHADRYRHASDEDRRMAQEMFESLAEAHSVLQDPARRRAYLAKLAREEDDAPPEPAHDTVVEPIPTPIRAASSSPGSAAASLYEVGLEHLRARRHHEAVEALRQAARLCPNEADYRAALGWALFRQAPADARAARAAIAELRRATQIDERNRLAAQHLAEIYAHTGQAEAAITELERLLALDPGAVEIAEELRRLRSR
jgi:DNA-binding response OmpR family regulator/tetratricopeptide (TPR) repeat protein